MSEEPYQQDAEQRERRPFGIILIVLALLLLLGGFFVARSSLASNLASTPAPTEEPTSTATNTPTNIPTTEATEEVTSQATEPPTEPAVEPPPTEEGPTCKETGQYCSCKGVSYSVVTCSDGTHTDTPIGSCTPDPGLCGTNPTEEPTTEPTEAANCATYTFCTCQGLVDVVTICADGSKTDTITSDACTPDASQCGAAQGGPDPKTCKPNIDVLCSPCQGNYVVCRDLCTGGVTKYYCGP